MKYLITILCFLFSFNSYAQRCQVLSEKIQPGHTIKIKYDPTGTDLENEKIFAVATTFEEELKVKLYDVELKNNGNHYTGSFKVPQDAHVISFNFENEFQTAKDNNEKKGYVHLVHTGQPHSQKTYLNATYALGAYARALDIHPDVEKAAMYFDKVIGGDASKKLDVKYINAYANLLQTAKNKEELAKIKPRIETILSDTKKISEKDFSNLIWAANTIGDDDLVNKIKDQTLAQYPNGDLATDQKFDNFRAIKEKDKAVQAFAELQAIEKNDKDYSSKLEYATEVLISHFVKAKDFKSVEKYVSTINSPSSKASIYNNLAWELAGGGMEGEAVDLNFAEKISKQSLEWIKEEMATSSGKPDYRTARQHKLGTEFSYGMYSDTYAVTVFKLGKIKEAIKYQKIAIETYKYRDVAMNERYATFLEKDQSPKVVISFLEKMISGGHANSAMKKQFERLYKENITIDEAYNLYFTQLEKEARAKQLEEIKKSMIEKDAPSFTLTNLNGETVSLESLKGKVVIVDFWATWCGPCVASFPGMQKAVDKYAEDDEVAFVFVDTWEGAKDKEKNAKDFLDEKGYKFNVLMDNENEMVAAYDVDGIPAKFILDQNGKIRYSGSGFGGNDDALISEISAMIEILKNENADSKNNMGTQP